MNNTDSVDVISKYIRDGYHIDLNEISFEAAKITEVSTRTE